MRFNHKIIGSVGALIMVSLSGLAFLQYNLVKDSMQAAVKSSIIEVTGSVSSQLDRVLAAKIDIFEFALQEIKEDYSISHIQQVLNYPAFKKQFLLAAVGFADGRLIDNDPNWQTGAGFVIGERPWYKNAISKQATIFTKPYRDSSTNELLISIAAPNYDLNNNIIGASFGDISLDFLAKTISNVKIADGAGKVFVASNDGTIISFPDKKYNGKNITNIESNLVINNKAQKVDIDGKPYLIGFLPIKNANWQVGYYVDLDMAYAEVNRLGRLSLIFGSSALLLSLIIMSLITKMLMVPVRALDGAISNLSSGDADLTQRLNTKSDYEFAMIAEKFNKFLAMLQEQVQLTQEGVGQIEINTHDTAKQSSGALSSIELQEKELEQLVTAMEEMSSTASEVASNAQNAADATTQAQMATDEGNVTVEHSAKVVNDLAEQIDSAISDVSELAQSSSDIGTILAVITGISEQTNLLALNAAIEAARAGEQGRGFAVVADEVRKLAQQTQDSTTEISNMIDLLQEKSATVVDRMNNSQQFVTNTVEIAQESNLALEKISEAVNNANDMIVQIASAAEEQSSVAVEINANANNISDASAKVATLMDNTATLTEQQLVYVEKLRDLINRFKV